MKTPNKSIESRKAKHVELCVDENVTFRTVATGFDDLRFEHNALPEISMDEVSLATTFCGRQLRAPLLISSMTGGYAGATEINAALARAAERFGLAIGVGSERQALESTSEHESFSVVRREAPGAFVIANLGALEIARLFCEKKLDQVSRIIDLIGADALAIHLNPVQEMLQPEGSTDFRGVLDGIAACVKLLQVPIIVKEVGAGISQSVATRVLEAGVQVIDVAGAGGTSWAGVEVLRNAESDRAHLEPFWDWGIPTVQALMAIRELKPEYTFNLIASGGIRNGIDIAKSISLGANIAGMARPLISELVKSGEASLMTLLEQTLFQLRGAMFLTGSKDLEALSMQPLYVR